MIDQKHDLRFRRHEHLRKSSEFDRVYRESRPVSDGVMKVFALSNGRNYSRLGLSVGKRWGNAVKRNRIKRLFREAYRLNKHVIPTGHDIVLVPRTRNVGPLSRVINSLVKLSTAGAKRNSGSKNRPN